MVCKNTDPCFFDMLAEKAISCQKPDIPPGSCPEQCHCNQYVACKDKNSKSYRLANPQRLTAAVVKIDDCVIKNDRGRDYDKCDYALLIGKSGYSPVAVLVELKGSDLEHAFVQIRATLKTLKPTLNKFSKVYVRIIASKVPSGVKKEEQYKKLKKDLMKDYALADVRYQSQASKTTQKSVDSVMIQGQAIVMTNKKA